MRLAVRLVATAVIVALAWVVLVTVLLWLYQERVVFQPPGVTPPAPARAQRIDYVAADGHALFGFVVSPANGERGADRTVVLAFHGNADLAAWQVPWARELAERTGATVVLPEYRGYSGIPGEPTYASAAADALGALRFVRSRLEPADVVLYGHSLGSAIATELAATMKDGAPKAVVLVSPFTSARDMAARMFVPPIPFVWSRISRVHYDSRALVAELESPLHVAHGTRDLNIPVRMGRQVHAAARHPGMLLIVEDAGHNDIVEMGGERYWSWLAGAVAGRGKRVGEGPGRESIRRSLPTSRFPSLNSNSSAAGAFHDSRNV